MTGRLVTSQQVTSERTAGPEQAGSEHRRRILVVRCPAWPPPGEPEAAAGHLPEPTARAFEQVVSAAAEFCPRIEVLRPGICAFGARGPARYFGGESELGRKVAAAVAGLGYECGVGIADGMFAALLSARDSIRIAAPVVVPPGGTAAFLAPRAITVLGAPDLTDLLVRLGIRTLGEFAAVPAVQAANRFGLAGLAAHRIARGLDPRPLAARPPAADLSVQAEFDPPAGESERVVFAAKTLAATMHARLAAAGLACVRVQVQVVSDNGEELSRLWRHDGLLSEFAVAERVRWQLDGWQASRRAGAQGGEGTGTGGGEGTGTGTDWIGDDGIQAAGICLLRLVPDQLVHDQGRQLGLWGDAVVSDRVARAAIRVQAMLGHDAVRQPLRSGGRNPSDQAVLVPFGDAQPASGDQAPARPLDRPWPGRIPPPAPPTVYQVPRQARVTDDSGALIVVTGRGGVQGDPAWLSVAGGPAVAITAWTGPWPVTERWWDREHACRKARFQLVTADGGAWLAVVQDGRWLIEASYD
jgi:protein ImuB